MNLNKQGKSLMRYVTKHAIVNTEGLVLLTFLFLSCYSLYIVIDISNVSALNFRTTELRRVLRRQQVSRQFTERPPDWHLPGTRPIGTRHLLLSTSLHGNDFKSENKQFARRTYKWLGTCK